ncbi:hypothetical protein NC653_020480 [Populus alba x Populus x berolinensis]|uniref:Uncharacterized protein n=1 Tax=Populus alba x Populus x berolinensis TaxID=444605 RepID=A0AAD6QCG4_9ROSI|nr:hypothetical protein NC653_020480 [Populus alba x Populus x berolinensis]
MLADNLCFWEFLQVEVQELLDEHRTILDAKIQEADFELTEKRKNLEEELRSKADGVRLLETEIFHREEKVVKEKDKSMKAEQKQLELQKKQLLSDEAGRRNRGESNCGGRENGCFEVAEKDRRETLNTINNLKRRVACREREEIEDIVELGMLSNKLRKQREQSYQRKKLHVFHLLRSTRGLMKVVQMLLIFLNIKRRPSEDLGDPNFSGICRKRLPLHHLCIADMERQSGLLMSQKISELSELKNRRTSTPGGETEDWTHGRTRSVKAVVEDAKLFHGRCSGSTATSTYRKESRMLVTVKDTFESVTNCVGARKRQQIVAPEEA